MGHCGGVRGGLDGRAVVLAVLALVAAVVLGAVAGTHAGAVGGVLGAVGGLVPPAVLALAVERRARGQAARERRAQILGKYAPPGPAGEGEGQG